MCSHFHFSDVSSLLKKSVGECFCWMDSDCSAPLCAPVAAFGGGADNCSLTGTLLWPAHLVCHFLHRVPVSPFPPVFPVSLVSRSASSSFWSLFTYKGYSHPKYSLKAMLQGYFWWSSHLMITASDDRCIWWSRIWWSKHPMLEDIRLWWLMPNINSVPLTLSWRLNFNAKLTR